ncbi:MAG: hypothetical protein JO247_14360 [Chloroflexi bacterium]|nr:hypothetical protein [Chloroflexota bacterium]
MLEPRAREQALVAPARELPRLPAVRDDRLVTALAQHLDGRHSPFGARLPTPGELVREAIFDPPPTLLHEQYQRSLGDALSVLAAAAGQLAAAAGGLSPRNAFNAFRQIGVTVSDPAVVSGVALSHAQAASYSLAVQQLAVSQENVGQLLPRDGTPSIEPGLHEVTIQTRQGRRQVMVEVHPGDDNEQVLASLAAAMNAEQLGGLATLARPTANLVQLVVTSAATGLASTFSFEPSRLVTFADADRVAREAADAVFELNGIRTTSPHNLVSVQGGNVQLTLQRGQPGGRVMLVVGADREGVLNAVQQLAEAASALARALHDNETALAPRVLHDYAALVQSMRDPLADVGIDVRADDAIVLDRALLAAAFARRPSAVEQAISSPAGAAQRLGEFAAEIMSAPMARLGSPELVPAMPAAGSHQAPPAVLASHTLSALLYAQLFSHGLFINTLF